MVKRHKTRFAVGIALAAVLVSLSGCEDLLNLNPAEDRIPDAVVELAGGVFGLVGMVFESEGDDPTTTTYPAGMAVVWVAQDTHLRIVLTNFAPPEEGATVRANGELNLQLQSQTPYRIGLVGSIELQGHLYRSVGVDGTATWAPNAEPGDDAPQSMSGTFTVDGTEYSLEKVFEAVQRAEDSDDDGPSDDPQPTGKPMPEPPFVGGMRLFQIAERNGGSGGTWTRLADSISHHFTLNESRTAFTLYDPYNLERSGTLEWHTVDSVMCLDLYVNGSLNVRYHVLAYGNDTATGKVYLHLRMAGRTTEVYYCTEPENEDPLPV